MAAPEGEVARPGERDRIGSGSVGLHGDDVDAELRVRAVLAEGLVAATRYESGATEDCPNRLLARARSGAIIKGTYRMTAPRSREAARSGQDGFLAWWEREDDCGVAIVGCGDEENGFGGEEHADGANREGRR